MIVSKMRYMIYPHLYHYYHKSTNKRVAGIRKIFVLCIAKKMNMSPVDNVRIFLISIAMTTKPPLLCLVASLGAVALSGCVIGPDYAPPQLERIASDNADFDLATLVDGQSIDDALLAEWWRTFDDGTLNASVETALEGNLSLAEAVTRISQARGILRQARSALYPGGGVGASVGTRQSSLETETGALFRQGLAPRDTDFYEVGLDAAWELDFFGGRRRGVESVRAQTEFAIESALAARSSVAAETVRVYFEIKALSARIAVAERAIESAQELRDLTAMRVASGTSPRLDLLQADALLSGSRALLPRLEAAQNQALNAYDLILGGVPGEFSDSLDLSAEFNVRAPMTEVASAPANVIARRPDLRAAERLYEAANANIGVAEVGFLPRVSIGGAIGYAALDTNDLFAADAVQYSVGPSVSWRLFDWMRIRGEIEAAEGRKREALIAYEQAAYRAVADLDNAVARLNASAETITHLDASTAFLEETRDVARIAYERGASSFLQVLDAQRALDGAEDRVIVARLDETLASVAAFQALGGGWSEKDRAAIVAETLEASSATGAERRWASTSQLIRRREDESNSTGTMSN